MALSSLPIELQPRDLRFLRGLFESRIITVAQASSIFFEDKFHYTKKRLQKLKTNGLIGERQRRVNEPGIHYLTKKGFALLRLRGELYDYPVLSLNAFATRSHVSHRTISHELSVMDVKAALYTAIRGSSILSIEEFTTWPLLNQFSVSSGAYASPLLVQPDGFLRIHEAQQGGTGFTHSFFLEVDKSSENQNVLLKHAALYQEHYRSGGFALENGGNVAQVSEFPFRVLMVLMTSQRRNNTAERLAAHSPPILRHTWLTTLDEILSNPLGPIWVVPADYRTCVLGTRFERQSTGSFNYRRDREREAHVESAIKKLTFLDD